MDPSLLPKDVLELGRLLVSECLDERDCDTLSRWFLHVIAERLVAFDKAKGEKARKMAEDAAADLILRFWRHRKATNLHVDPMTRFDKLFESLELLLPKSNPWLLQNTSLTERLAAELFESLSALTAGFMLLSVYKPDGEPDRRHLFARFLPANQQALLNYFESVAISLTKQKSKSAVEDVSLSSSTMIDTVRAWALLIRRNLDEVDQILDDASTKLQAKPVRSKKKKAKKVSSKPPATGADKKKPVSKKR
jgi:hypothetical protein